jgi:NADH dehydrogenase FAD-containing subunit
VDEQYRHRLYPEIYAVGMAAQPAVAATANAGVPKTGYLAAAMAKAAARSIVATLTRTVPVTRPLPRLLDARIIDGGDCGMAMISVGRKHTFRVAVSLPGATAHRLKNILRCYLLWKLRTGRTYLP